MKLKKRLRNYWSKFWYILWKDDSFKGWLFSVIFLIVFILFIFFPLLRFATGTVLPLAIVESCSMYHEGNLLSDYDEWWNGHDSKYSSFQVKKLDFQNFIFKNGFNKGDILFIIGAKPEKIKIGDVIIFNANRNNPIIHRAIDIRENNGEFVFSTIGDNNPGQLGIEKLINSDQLVGKAVFKIAPYLGWTKLIFYERIKSPSERGFCSEN
jgi:signal peptidase I